MTDGAPPEQAKAPVEGPDRRFDGDGSQAAYKSGTWTFLTNHAHVLLVIRHDPYIRLQGIAQSVGITVRATQFILGDLERAGYIRRTRLGRRNQYTVIGGALRHPLEQGRAVDDLLAALGTPNLTRPDAPAAG